MMYEELNREKVICMVCGERHFPDEDTFLTFYGNVTIGTQGGIIGNNFDEHGILNRAQYICRKEACILKIIGLRYRNIDHDLILREKDAEL